MTVTDTATPTESTDEATQPEPSVRGAQGLLFAAAAVAIASTLLAILAGSDHADMLPNGFRVAVVVAAVTMLPGAPIAILLRLRRPALVGSVTVSISFSTILIIAQAEVVSGNLWPVTVQLYICAISAALILWASRTLVGATPRPRPDRTAALTRYGLLGALVVAVALFWRATAVLEPQASGALGIITHVGPSYLIALLIVAAVIAFGLSRARLDPVVLGAAGLALIMFTTMYVSLADGVTSVPTAYTHRGLIDIIASLQGLPPPSDARFSWAGFFSAGAHISGAGGLSDLSPMLLWAPLFFGGVTMFPLYSIAMSLTGRRRVAWIAVVLYLSFNWYQQDYFAPQPTATMLYLTICALLLWQLQTAPLPAVAQSLRRWVLDAPRRTLGTVRGFGAGRTLAIEGLMVVMIAAIVITHQLTPIVLIASLFLFALTGTTRYRLLWLVAAAIFVAWFSYGAVDYWKGHLAYVLGDVGQVSGAVQGGVSDRIGADPLYQRMQYLRLAASGALLVFAFAGWLTYRQRKTWLIGGLLCMVPFGLVLVQSYGGEVVIRCFVLASPFIAPYAADALVRTFAVVRKFTRRAAEPRHWSRTVAATAAILGVALVLTATRGLNTSFEHTDEDQIRYGDALMRSVPEGSEIMVIGTAASLVSARYFDDVRVSTMESFECLDDLSGCVRKENPDFVFTTRQSSAQIYLQYGYSQSVVDQQLGVLVGSDEYRVVVETADLTILQNASSPPVLLR
ncbi:serine/threonine protein kinase [Rhodococcus sp. 077-4]|uniref:serine/threonine protein kinase n=1 Tax=Rhodococcus sp. 077-4 TaxID=2789271 RepID=UPI0039F4D5C3